MAGPFDRRTVGDAAKGTNAQPTGSVDQVCTGCEEKNWTETGLIDETTGKPVPGIPYKIFDINTKEVVASGTLDENGLSQRHDIPLEHTSLFVMYGTDDAIDEALEEMERLQKEQALQANARNNWRGIPAGLNEQQFNDAYDRKTYENGGRFEKPSASLLEAAGYGANMLYDYVFSGFDSDHMIDELYKDDRARSFDEYQLVTGAREATKGESLGAGTGQGVSFGFSEEFMAWLDSTAGGRDYDQALADRRQILKAEELSNSGWYLGGEIAGGVPTIFIPVAGAAGKAAQGANAGSKVLAGVKAGAKTGAALGAVSGAGHDTGGVVDRLDGAAWGAVTGGIAGALLGGAGVLVARGASRTRIWAKAKTKKTYKFDDLQSMDSHYVGEEAGHVFASKVQYLDDEARKAYQLTVRDGKVYDANGKLFDTSDANSVFSEGKAIFVMDDVGNIYASKVQEIGKFHHSSFLSGQPVASAGEISVKNGIIREVTRKSGHYRPTPAQLDQFIQRIADDGVNTGKIKIGDGF